MRRFGTWLLLEPGELEPYLAAKVGEEPLGRFTAKALGERLAGRRAPLKAALLDQRTVAGLGNIYVDEALWYARLHPLRVAGDLDADEVRRLHRGIRRALELGIARQGSTLTRLPAAGRLVRLDAATSSGRTAGSTSRATAAARRSRRRASAAAARGSARRARPCNSLLLGRERSSSAPAWLSRQSSV